MDSCGWTKAFLFKFKFKFIVSIITTNFNSILNMEGKTVQFWFLSHLKPLNEYRQVPCIVGLLKWQSMGQIQTILVWPFVNPNIHRNTWDNDDHLVLRHLSLNCLQLLVACRKNNWEPRMYSHFLYYVTYWLEFRKMFMVSTVLWCISMGFGHKDAWVELHMWL